MFRPVSSVTGILPGPFSAAAAFWSGIPFSAVAGTVAGTISVSLVAGILDYFGVSCGWYSGPVAKGILNWTPCCDRYAGGPVFQYGW